MMHSKCAGRASSYQEHKPKTRGGAQRTQRSVTLQIADFFDLPIVSPPTKMMKAR